ncbi:MAG TPA: hypothetical protein VM076_09360 [Gemmatimonadaceae bacterium]|nr:hypothetical protein [Gemmatimonadaceae bacterium]
MHLAGATLANGRRLTLTREVVRHPTEGGLTMLYASLAPGGEPADVRMIVHSR